MFERLALEAEKIKAKKSAEPPPDPGMYVHS